MLSLNDFIPDLLQSHFYVSSQSAVKNQQAQAKDAYHAGCWHVVLHLGPQRPGVQRQGHPSSESSTVSPRSFHQVGDQSKGSLPSCVNN